MPLPLQAAEMFRNLDFHDHSLVEVRILPATVKGPEAKSTIEIYLKAGFTAESSMLRFTSCANVRVAMDFDVLTQNLPPNTSCLEADASEGHLRNLVESQKRDWGVQYTGSAGSPIAAKLGGLEALLLFRVQFFGGVVEVLAPQFQAELGKKPK